MSYIRDRSETLGEIQQRLNVPGELAVETSALRVARLAEWQMQPDAMPSEGPSSGFGLVQLEAKVRLSLVCNGPLCDHVPHHIATACANAFDKVQFAAVEDGPMDLALNESNVRGMMNWNLDEVGVAQVERQALIKLIEGMGIRLSETVETIGIIRSGVSQPPEDSINHFGSRSASPARLERQVPLESRNFDTRTRIRDLRVL